MKNITKALGIAVAQGNYQPRSPSLVPEGSRVIDTLSERFNFQSLSRGVGLGRVAIVRRDATKSSGVAPAIAPGSISQAMTPVPPRERKSHAAVPASVAVARQQVQQRPNFLIRIVQSILILVVDCLVMGTSFLMVWVGLRAARPQWAAQLMERVLAYEPIWWTGIGMAILSLGLVSILILYQMLFRVLAGSTIGTMLFKAILREPATSSGKNVS